MSLEIADHDVDDYTMRGWIFRAIQEEDRIDGFSVWENVIAPLWGKEPPYNFKASPYIEFKDELRWLTAQDFIRVVERPKGKNNQPTKSLVRFIYVVTVEGAEWWGMGDGYKQNGPKRSNRPEEWKHFVGKKWKLVSLGATPQHVSTERDLFAAARRGDIELAIRWRDTSL